MKSVNDEQSSSWVKDGAWMKELEDKVSNLEEEMKIKDQLLAETEKNIEENYAVKYELAELKEKYNEIKSALEQRDAYINELEQTK